jgi:hypothetical protein
MSMIDLPTLRRVTETYDASYPPSVLGGGPDPSITTLTPSTVSAAAGPTTITVAGTNFEAASIVEVNQVAQSTTYVSPTSLTISYDPSTVGTVQFTVRNPNDEESNSVPFVVGALAGTQAAPKRRNGKTEAAMQPTTPDRPERPAPQPDQPVVPNPDEPDQPEPRPQPGPAGEES